MFNEISINNRYELLIEDCKKEKIKAISALDHFFENPDIDYLWDLGSSISSNQKLNPSQQKLPSLNYVRGFLDKETVLKQIDSLYWGRLFKETNILSYTSSSIREEWNNQIYNCEVPEFNINSVRPTISSLIKDLPELFSQRLRDAHDVLSRSHKTNKAQRFGKRMIFQVATPNNWGSYNMSDRTTGAINDIRSTISQLFGGQQFNYWDTRDELNNNLFRKGKFNEWIKIDRFIAVKIFMKGTCHLEIDPLICDKLNSLLSDNTIPDMSASWYQAEQRKKETEFHDLANMMISTELLKAIRDDKPNGDYFWDYIEHGTYDHKPVLQYVADTGFIPEYKSHQFYPTPPIIAERIREELKHTPIRKTILEPSAGTGRLIDKLCKDNITAIDIAPLHCEILKAKGFYDVINMDFLDYPEHHKFDVILMNPPYSKSRALTHINKAKKHLNKGGFILAVVPSGKITNEMEVIEEFKGVFDNTNINTALVRINGETK